MLTTEECQTYLQEARAALHAINTGQQVIMVRNENTQTQYGPANVSALVQYIAQLELQCGCTDGTGKRREPIGVIF